jgi:hypothetical protein
MLTDDDKKWIAAQICAKEGCMEAPTPAYESRFWARLEKFEAALIAKFQKWTLPREERSFS